MAHVEFETATLPLLALPPVTLLGVGTAGLPPRVGPLQWLGVTVLLAGVGFWLWAVIRLRRGGSSTAAPTGELVDSGPYAVTRNPMYVGVAVAVAGVAVALPSVAVLLAEVPLLGGFHWLIVSFEEPLVRETVGEPFERYCERVPRWIPPFG